MALRGQPCLTPECIGMEGVLPIGVRTSVVAPVYAFWIIATKSVGKPMWVRVVRRAECGTLPNALRMSSQARHKGRGWRLASFTIDSRRKACS